MTLKKVNSIEELQESQKTHPNSLVYFGDEGCSVCQTVKPRIEALLRHNPHVQGLSCSVKTLPEAAGQYVIFTIPAVLIFSRDREIYRSVRFIDFDRIESLLAVKGTDRLT